MLDGGYDRFELFYPACTTNAGQRRTKKVLAMDYEIIIDSIEYPSINDIEMKDVIVKKLKEEYRPTIDRSSKQTALKHLEERELLMEKAKQSTLANYRAESEILKVHGVWWLCCSYSRQIQFYEFLFLHCSSRINMLP